MSIHEECGVFGIFSPTTTTVAQTTYYGLFSLQHRGQESAGIVVNDMGIFKTYKDSGLVNDVFTKSVIKYNSKIFRTFNLKSKKSWKTNNNDSIINNNNIDKSSSFSSDSLYTILG